MVPPAPAWTCDPLGDQTPAPPGAGGDFSRDALSQADDFIKASRRRLWVATEGDALGLRPEPGDQSQDHRYDAADHRQGEAVVAVARLHYAGLDGGVDRREQIAELVGQAREGAARAGRREFVQVRRHR